MKKRTVAAAFAFLYASTSASASASSASSASDSAAKRPRRAAAPTDEIEERIHYHREAFAFKYQQHLDELHNLIVSLQKVQTNYMNTFLNAFLQTKPLKEEDICFDLASCSNCEEHLLKDLEHYEVATSSSDYDLLEHHFLIQNFFSSEFIDSGPIIYPCLECSYFDRRDQNPVYVVHYHPEVHASVGTRHFLYRSHVNYFFHQCIFKSWLVQSIWYGEKKEKVTDENLKFYVSWIPEEVLSNILDLVRKPFTAIDDSLPSENLGCSSEEEYSISEEEDE
jgi:hypothetical protein